MKKSKEKIILLALGFSFLLPIANVNATDVMNKEVILSRNSEIVPYVDNIIKKYRIHNGQSQYRRWNVTRGCWVDRDWINM